MKTPSTIERPLLLMLLAAAVLSVRVPSGAQEENKTRQGQEVATTEGEPGKQTVELKAGELTLLLGNEFDHGAGKTGYIGIWNLTSVHEQRNIFFHRYAGWIQHRHRANVERISDSEGAIQHFLPDGRIWSRQTFKIVPPYSFDCTFSRPSTSGAESFNGTSYMNGPKDPGVYFVTPDLEWQRHHDPVHGNAASIYAEGMPLPKLQKVPDATYKHGTNAFSDSVSKWRYHPDYALFYGRFGKMVLIHMFPPRCGVIPYMSPSGGGRQPDGRNNPAWDWRGRFKNLEIKDGWSQFTMRAVYKPYVSDDDVLEEYQRWARETP
ncbi:MAG: hypothetical protein ISR77_28610 [Pirellulaceae bacterium]|nr:hypothetical protein [Pirellulaceae bacterium]